MPHEYTFIIIFMNLPLMKFLQLFAAQERKFLSLQEIGTKFNSICN